MHWIALSSVTSDQVHASFFVYRNVSLPQRTYYSTTHLPRMKKLHTFFFVPTSTIFLLFISSSHYIVVFLHILHRLIDELVCVCEQCFLLFIIFFFAGVFECIGWISFCMGEQMINMKLSLLLLSAN